MAAGDEQIFETVVVEVEHARTPAAQRQAGCGNATERGHIDKPARSQVSEEGKSLIGQCGNEKVFPAVIIVVAEIGAHGGERLAILVVGDARFQRDLPEFTAAFIVEQKVRYRIISDEDVQKSVAIVIAKNDSHALAWVGSNAGLSGNIAEGPIALIVIQRVGQGPVVPGMAVAAIPWLV